MPLAVDGSVSRIAYVAGIRTTCLVSKLTKWLFKHFLATMAFKTITNDQTLKAFTHLWSSRFAKFSMYTWDSLSLGVLSWKFQTEWKIIVDCGDG